MIVHGTSVGLDVHALSVVAHAVDEETGKISRARLCPDHGEVLSWLHQLRAPVRVTYEAGPTGFGLARAINDAGMECLVAAPSKLHRPAGDRVKTDARDAAHLARLLRLDEITAVSIPEPEIEAVRDLVRAREDARADLMRVRHRLSKLLLRQGIVYLGGAAWTCKHEEWLRRHRFADVHLNAAFDHSFDAVLAATAARDRLDEQILEVSASPRFADPVNRLGCLRGISALTGLALTAEIGDWSRFTGSSIGAYVGLVPSECSSGTSRVQGSITKAGNTHVRRLLIESAWHHRKSYSTSGPSLRARWDKVDPALRARGHAGNRRLNKRWRTFLDRGKNPIVANVAIARELSGWCWSLATMQ
ncbi:IS110 family transposase [Mycolicibacterium septicum]|uniref:IS110 family transposase n=1 Tax=Mycolicibacterium septicum TaxID=98668 RepID=A0ABW9M5P4_9MYCO